MKRHTKTTKMPYQFMRIFGLGLTALALATSPVDAASSPTKGKTHSRHQKVVKPSQTTYPPIQPTARTAYAPTRSAAAPVAAASPAERNYTFGEMASESMFGDVYGDPSKWEELGYGNLFSKGWNKPWVSPPAGGGGAPRQGWLNADDGVFYRLSLASFSWQHGTGN